MRHVTSLRRSNTVCCCLQNITPVFLAAKLNHVEILHTLLDHGADVIMPCDMTYVVGSHDLCACQPSWTALAFHDAA